MKAVVVEIKDRFAAILSEDGCISKVKDRHYMIGQEIEMKKERIHITKKLAICAASAAMFILASGTGVLAYQTPYSYVSLDVNPSIEFTVNRFDRVIDVTAVNDDGEAILDNINLKDLNNKTITKAIVNTVGQIADDGYFSGDVLVSGGTNVVTSAAITMDGGLDIKINGAIVIATSSKDPDKSDELANELEDAIEEETGDGVEVDVISVGLERVQKARELGVTPGKLNLVEKLQASSADPDSIVLEEWLNKPVKEIMKATKENRKAAKAGIISNEDKAEVVEAVDEDTTNAIQETIEDTDKNDKKSEDKVQKTLDKKLKKTQKTTEKTQKTTEKIAERTVKTKEKSADKVQKSEEKNIKAEEKNAKAKEKATKAEEKAKVEEKNTNVEEKNAKVEEKNTKVEEKNTKAEENATKAKEQKAEKSQKEDKNTVKEEKKSIGNSSNVDKPSGNSTKDTKDNNTNNKNKSKQ